MAPSPGGTPPTWRNYTHSFKPTYMPDVMKQAAAVEQKVKELTLGLAR